jgi:hypothetical protein
VLQHNLPRSSGSVSRLCTWLQHPAGSETYELNFMLSRHVAGTIMQQWVLPARPLLSELLAEVVPAAEPLLQLACAHLSTLTAYRLVFCAKKFVQALCRVG